VNVLDDPKPQQFIVPSLVERGSAGGHFTSARARPKAFDKDSKEIG
jgi:hypothetical protein